jgi:small-conductance mechanosensitive channel
LGLPFIDAANNPIARQQRQDLFLSLLLISLTIIVVRVITGWLKMLAAKSLPASVSILNYLLNGVALIVVLLIGLVLLEAPVSVILLTVAGSSVGLGLAFNEPLSNLFSGVQLTASRRLNPGDYVRLPSGKEGYVVDIQWDVTTVRQIEDNLIIVPNSVMVKAEIINYQLPEPEMFVLADVGVSYDSDLETVERVTVEVANGVMHDVSGAVPTSSPFIRYRNFADFSINFTVFMRGQEFFDQLLIKHEFIKRLHKRYREEDIVIPYPIRTLHTPTTDPITVVSHSLRSDSDPTTGSPGMAPTKEG